MVAGWLATLSTEERVLLHLLTNPLKEGAWDVSPELTQEYIANAVHTRRKHIPRTLKQAMKRDLIWDDTRHIIGAKQRRKVYGLTYDGRQSANAIKRRVLAMEISKGDEIQDVSKFKFDIPLLEFLSHLDETCIWQEDAVSVPIIHQDNKALSDDKRPLIKAMLKKAWQDGKITDDEQSLIEAMASFLHIAKSTIGELSTEVRLASEKSFDDPEKIYFDLLMQAISDGVIIDSEAAMLTTLRNAVGISQETHSMLLLKAKKQLDSSPYLLAYADAVRVALADGIITSDEEAILSSMRESFGISMGEHEKIEKEERSKFE